MGKASSAKKVARAARTGGRVSSGQPRSLLFPTVITLVLLLGVSLVVYARNERNQNSLSGVPQLGDHIHEAIGFNVCGQFLPNIPTFESKIGIHTHGDGVMHIHPFSQLGVGANATLGRFLKDAHDEGQIDVSLSDTKLKLLGETAQGGQDHLQGGQQPRAAGRLLARRPERGVQARGHHRRVRRAAHHQERRRLHDLLRGVERHDPEAAQRRRPRLARRGRRLADAQLERRDDHQRAGAATATTAAGAGSATSTTAAGATSTTAAH